MTLRALLAAGALFLNGAACAEENRIKLVYFTADWCANCAVLDPALDAAVARVDAVTRIDVDFSTPESRAESRARAQALNVGPVHDAWVGAAGFAAIVAADSGEVIGCVTSVYAAGEIESALRRARARVVSLPEGHRAFPGRSACPARNAIRQN